MARVGEQIDRRGLLVVEAGGGAGVAEQGEAVRVLLRDGGFVGVDTARDLDANRRRMASKSPP